MKNKLNIHDTCFRKCTKTLMMALGLLFYVLPAHANFITATPSNYTSYLNTLTAGDTLYLTQGVYTNNLTLNYRSGTSLKPIVIMGSANLYTTVFQAQSCCNTISITKCAYLIIKNLKLDGLNIAVDAVKAEGTVGNWAHHITIEYLNIVNYGNNQQIVGISTKCSTWNWIIRKNRIIGAGTGMYLGNSDGSKPFVNGIIENNFIANTIGYNIEIKHQFNGVRDSFPETMVNGKTILRYNVFTKDQTAATGANARPNLLVGGFPTSGWGAQDYYEIYGNFFYNNPVEALFQGTGNIALYNNIFVNHYDPSGYRAVYFTPQNGVSPQDLKIFHNTIWVNNSSGGLRLFSPNTAFKQSAIGNVVFATQPITNFVDSGNNIVDAYNNASNYVIAANVSLGSLNLYPQNGRLTGTTASNTNFNSLSAYNKDFNNDNYDWSYRGAYSGCCSNNGWKLQLDTMPSFKTAINGIRTVDKFDFNPEIFPNPCNQKVTIRAASPALVTFYNELGKEVKSIWINKASADIEIDDLPGGVYLLKIATDTDFKWVKLIHQL